MTLDVLSAALLGMPAADPDQPVPAGPRHRAPEPSSREAPDNTTVILPGWAAYGRHAAPMPEAAAGRSLPAVPLRRRNTVEAVRPDADEQHPDAGPDAAAAEAPTPPVLHEQEVADVPEPGTAPVRTVGILRRCLGPWRRTTGTDGLAAQDAEATRCA